MRSEGKGKMKKAVEKTTKKRSKEEEEEEGAQSQVRHNKTTRKSK